MRVEFLRANENDASRMINLQNSAFKADYIKYGHCPSYNEPLENMKIHIKDKLCYIITADGEDAGDIIVRKKEDSCSYYLRVLAIVPRFQNMHIGKEALEFLERNNTDYDVWELITPKDRIRNCHFYESNGFVKTGERKDDEKLTLNKYRKQIHR